MKYFFALIKIALVISLFANIVGCGKEITAGKEKTSVVQEKNNTSPDTAGKNESGNTIKDINTYHDEKFGFSVDFPRGWSYRINKYIEPSKDHNGTPDAGIVIFIENNPKESIYVFGQVGSIAIGDPKKGTFTTVSGLSGDLFVIEKDGIKDMKVIFGRQSIGAFVLASPETYNKNEAQIMSILKSIRIDFIPTTEKLDQENINALVKKSVSIQYENKTDELDNVFTKEFISKIEDSFYKSKLKPYNILSISDPVFDGKDAGNSFYVKTRIRDAKGEYIQEIHFSKVSGMYLISKIENDI